MDYRVRTIVTTPADRLTGDAWGRGHERACCRRERHTWKSWYLCQGLECPCAHRLSQRRRLHGEPSCPRYPPVRLSSCMHGQCTGSSATSRSDQPDPLICHCCDEAQGQDAPLDSASGMNCRWTGASLIAFHSGCRGRLSHASKHDHAVEQGCDRDASGYDGAECCPLRLEVQPACSGHGQICHQFMRTLQAGDFGLPYLILDPERKPLSLRLTACHIERNEFTRAELSNRLQ